MSFNYEQLQSSSDNAFKDILESRKKGSTNGRMLIMHNKNRFVKYIMFGGLVVIVILIVMFMSKTKELAGLNEEKMKLNMYISQVSSEEMQLKQSLSNGNEEKENIIKENEKITNDIKELKLRKTTLINDHEDILSKINDIKKKLSKIQDEIELITDSNKEAQNKLRSIDEDGEDKYTTEINKLRKKIKELESKIEDAEYNIKHTFKTKESKILTSSQEVSALQRLLGSNYELDLIYSSTKDNFSSYEFHNNVGNKRPTVSLIKMRNGQIIGGYTKQSWQGNGFKEDDDAFIFNLSKDRTYPVRESKQAIYCDEKYGVVFGKGDILITDNESTSNFPSTYGKRGSSELELTDGNYLIQMEAIEVFTLN